MSHIRNFVRLRPPLLRMSRIRNSIRRHSTIFRMSHIWNFVRRHSTFSGCLTSGILSSVIPPSPDVSHLEFYSSPFHLLRMSHIRKFVRRHSTFSGYFISSAWRRMGEEGDSTSPDSHVRILWWRSPGEHPQPTIQIPYSHFLYFFFKFKLLNGFPISKPFQ